METIGAYPMMLEGTLVLFLEVSPNDADEDAVLGSSKCTSKCLNLCTFFLVPPSLIKNQLLQGRCLQTSAQAAHPAGSAYNATEAPTYQLGYVVL